MSFSVNETNSNITVTEATTELVVEDRAARVTVSADEMSVEITSPGPQGPVGPGVPLGGVTNDVLVKLSGTQYDTGWRDEITVDQINFDTAAGEDLTAPGQMAWDSEFGTFDSVLENGTDLVTMHVGQDVYYRVVNNTASTIAKGKLVMAVAGPGSSGKIAIQLAVADGSVPSQYIMGVTAQSIAAGADGFVVHFGKIRKLDTQTPGWQVGDILWADPATPGGLTKVEPAAPNSRTIVAIVLSRNQSNGQIFVRPTYGSDLADDERVRLTNLTDGQTLLYNGTVGVFENATLTASDVSGVVPSTRNLTASTGLSGGGDLSADRSFAVLYGTTAGTAAQGNDARLSDARTPLAHASTHHTGGSDPLTATNIGAVPEARQVASGTGLAGGGDLSADRTLSVLYGTTAGTAAQGNAARLSDARTPTAHASSHFTGGSDPIAATNIGAVPEGRQVIAGTGLSGGGDLSADRTLAVLYGTTAGTAAQGNDARLSDARTPTAHASSHFTGGSDPIAATNIGAVPEGRQIIAGTALTGGGTLAADRTLNVLIGTTSGAVASGDRGLITGGTAPQVLRKTSGTDYAVEWGSVWEDDQTILAGQVFG